MSTQAPVSAGGRPTTPGYYASHWRSLDYFNLYRLTLALALVFTALLFGDSDLFSDGSGVRFRNYTFGYLIVTALFVLGIRARWPDFQVQLSAHIVADIVFVVLLMSASPQLAGGLGLLLVVSIASGGLVGSGRLTLLYAALASIAVLLQHGLMLLRNHGGADSFFQIGLLCMGYFATGLLAHGLTQRALRSETLAAKQAKELALLNRINALAIENSPDGLLAVRGDGIVQHASPRALKLLGDRAAVVPGRSCVEACAPELADALSRCRAGAERMAIPLTLGGRRLRVRCIPLATQEGSLVVILEDLSQAEEAAQRLKLAALGRLTANIAHEIRNPLSAISHAAQLLREDGHNHGRLPEIIDNNAQRLNRLVEEVLTLNRRDRIKPVRFDGAALHALIEEIRRTEEIPAEAVIVAMPDSVRFSFDPDHLRQILWNLLRNAWRHSRKQAGSLHLGLEARGTHLQLTLTDDGAGVSPEHRDQLFEPFFTTDAQGTGLGLFLARELAEANAAQLAYVPTPEGASFRLSLPLAT